MKKNKIKSGDTVEIIAGSFFGKVGKVTKFNKDNNSVYLEEIFREKFLKENNKKISHNKENIENDSQDQTSKKKKILIPINISNVKKIYNSDIDGE